MNSKSRLIVLVVATIMSMSVLRLPAAGRVDLLHLSHVHRGGGKLERPDNTLETFKWCWENGSALECDCRKTKDGVGIMLHDKTLKRTARGIPAELAKKDVSKEVAWAEIKDVDVGSYLKELNPAAADFSHHRIPTIEATFAAMKGHPTYLCFVDEKGAGPGYIAAKAREAGVLDQVYYTGQDYGKALEWNKATKGGKTLIWIGTWPKPKHTVEDTARFEAHYEKKMDEMRANDFKGVSAVSLHTYYDPKAADPFVPSTAYPRRSSPSSTRTTSPSAPFRSRAARRRRSTSSCSSWDATAFPPTTRA